MTAPPDVEATRLRGNRLRLQVSRVGLVATITLVLLTTLVFWPVSRHGFVHWDDDYYVLDNQQVLKGLTLEGLRSAFVTETAGNWHPLTMISHMLDVQVYGLNPGRHHMTSLILHLCGTILLFLFLCSCTARRWRSAVVAALFAVHPLHVESVAWVAERKDVLSGVFWMLVLLAYVAFVRRRTAQRYLAVLLAYALGLLAKPMLVTLPVIMLLLDYWPLGRFAKGGHRESVRQLLLEKTPFLFLSAVSSVITFLVQVRAESVSGLDVIPVGQRLANAASSYVQYLWKTVAPADLVFLYLYPLRARNAGLPIGTALLAVGAALVLAVCTLLVARSRDRHPALLVGWLWYLIALLPVSGIIQVGMQSMADRYTYMPLIGVFLMVAWCIPAPVRSAQHGVTVVLALAIIAALALAARNQIGHWKDDISLFGHAVRVDPENWIAQNNLGNALAGRGLLAEAVPHFEQALRANPTYFEAWYNFGLTRYREGRLDDAAAMFRKAISFKPDFAAAHDNLGAALLRRGRSREALGELEEAHRLKPGNPVTLNNMGAAWLSLGDLSRAEGYYRDALRLRADYGAAKQGLEAIRQRRNLSH